MDTVILMHVTHSIGCNLDETLIYKDSPTGIKSAFRKAKELLQNIKIGHEEYMVKDWETLEKEYLRDLEKEDNFHYFDSNFDIRISREEVLV